MSGPLGMRARTVRAALFPSFFLSFSLSFISTPSRYTRVERKNKSYSTVTVSSATMTFLNRPREGGAEAPPRLRNPKLEATELVG
jgi:hypothetical protein